MNTTEMAIASLGPAAERWAFPMESAMLNGGIVSQLEKSHFVAQMAHESLGFAHVEENLSYSAKRLREVFRRYFPTDELATAYAHRPDKIGNRVYGNRMGNGNEASGDGYKFRGRSPIMLTGKDNYNAASFTIFNAATLLNNPDLAMFPETGSKIAVWFWLSRKCGIPALLDDIEHVTLKINGGLNGLDDRKVWLAKTKKAFGI